MWNLSVLLRQCLGAALLVFCCQVPAHSSSKAQSPSKPNVLLVTIDTLRPDHLGCYGYRRITTPNIDSLATDGIRFEKAFTPVPITLPAHAALLTGTYPLYNGMHDFSGNKLNPNQATLASVLKENGYTTGAVVASAVLDSRFGLNSGFDFYYDHFDFSRLLETNLDAMERPGNVVVDEALTWLARNSRKKFFFWLHLYDPHAPYRPPAPYSQQYRSQPYDGEIAFADAQLGRVLRFLKQQNLYRNTLIALAGDHGEGLGEHGEKTHGFFIYNSTLHIPLLLKMPAGRLQNVRGRNAVPVSLIDLAPTLLNILNIKAPPSVQGRNLLPALQGKSEQGGSDLYAESFLARLHFNWSELRGLQIGNYKFIETSKPELYDVAQDPGELRNLYESKKALATEYQRKLSQVVASHTPDRELAQQTGLDPALAERLKSLGYAAVAGGGTKQASSSQLSDPKDRIQLYELVSEAIEDSQHGRYDPSIQKLLTALNTEQNSVPIRYLLGINYFRKQEYANAITHFERVVELSPDYALATFQLGMSYAHIGNLDQAIRYLRRTLELDATNFSAAFNLGTAYLQQQKVAEALAAFRRAVEIYPGYAAGHQAIGRVLLHQGEIDAALSALQEAARLEPRDPVTHMALAKAYELKGLPQQAQDELEKARQLQTR
jgi:arylsulfatase A-like enzyme/Flp pilus assembly protein TadD